MEVVGDGADGGVVGDGFYLLGVDGGDVVGDLDAASDLEEAFLADDEAQALEGFAGDEGVGDAGLVFEADEHVAAGGAGALAADDQSGDGDDLAVARLLQVDRAPGLREGLADVGHRVRAGGEVEAFVVGGEAFDRLHRGEG